MRNAFVLGYEDISLVDVCRRFEREICLYFRRVRQATERSYLFVLIFGSEVGGRTFIGNGREHPSV